jgi:hypothetical protein
MDGVYSKTNCFKFPINDKCHSLTGGTWVSNNYIRNRGQVSLETEIYDEGYPNYLVNNSPPITLYVRVAPSQLNKNNMVFWINGWERPRLILTSGKKYQFNISTCGHPFYFSDENNNKITNLVASDYNLQTITITDNLPKKFLYKCSIHSNMGGEVIIHS